MRTATRRASRGPEPCSRSPSRTTRAACGRASSSTKASRAPPSASPAACAKWTSSSARTRTATASTTPSANGSNGSGRAYGDPSETEFDPTADHDHDGVSTLDEALAGTNPFDADDALRIKTFVLDAETLRGATNALTSLSFPVVLGRAYAVQTADAPTGTWSSVSFFLAPGDAAPVNVISVSSKATAAVEEPVTVYLLPAPDRDAAFFRVKVEGDAKPEN